MVEAQDGVKTEVPPDAVSLPQEHTPQTLIPKNGSLFTPLENFFAHPLLHCLLLVVLVFACYGRTLSSFFLADDFGEVSYASRIFHGEPQLLWLNWTGNFMQIPGMNVYRPWLLMSLVFDWLAYGTNAAGYYTTNLLYFSGSVILLYAIVRRITSHWSGSSSKFTAFFTACFFAASPLRCESVSWVVGRVDIICGFFYLASLFCFLQTAEHRSKIAIALGVASFWLALLTKEMAVGLPAVLFAYEFLRPFDDSKNRSLSQRFVDALRFTLPLWLSLVAYFVIRYLCLGTLIGGYVAGFGASQSSHMMQRWLDPDTVRRFVFPFSNALFPQPTIYSQCLSACYAILLVLVVLRLLQGRLPFKWCAFLLVWLGSTAAPIYQLWGLGYNLEGARFYMFLSVPLSLLVPLFLFRPSQNTDPSFESKLRILTVAAFSFSIFILGRITYLSDTVWVHAGKEVRKVFQCAQQLARTANKTEKYCLLGIPKDRDGAHQILNGATFDTMLSPPFVSQELNSRFLTFDPIMFSPAEMINATRFSKELLRKGSVGPYVWSRQSEKFILNPLPSPVRPPISMPLPVQSSQITQWQPYTLGRSEAETVGGGIHLSKIQDGDALRISGLNVNPLDADYLEFRAKGLPAGVEPKFKLLFHGKKAIDFSRDDFAAVKSWKGSQQFETIRIHASHFWRWYACGVIDELVLLLPPAEQIELTDFKLVAASTLSPAIELGGPPIDNRGVQTIGLRGLMARIHSRDMQSTSGAVVQISKPNFFFDNFENGSNVSPVAGEIALTIESSPRQAGKREPSGKADRKAPTSAPNGNALMPLKNAESSDRKGQPAHKPIGINPEYFIDPGYYQLRARCVDEHNNPLGEYSDPVTVRRQY